jgi:hypothetical protein
MPLACSWPGWPERLDCGRLEGRRWRGPARTRRPMRPSNERAWPGELGRRRLARPPRGACGVWQCGLLALVLCGPRHLRADPDTLSLGAAADSQRAPFFEGQMWSEYSREVPQQARTEADNERRTRTLTCQDGRWRTGCLLMACKRSGVRIPIAPLSRSRPSIRTVVQRLFEHAPTACSPSPRMWLSAILQVSGLAGGTRRRLFGLLRCLQEAGSYRH